MGDEGHNPKNETFSIPPFRNRMIQLFCDPRGIEGSKLAVRGGLKWEEAKGPSMVNGEVPYGGERSALVALS